MFKASEQKPPEHYPLSKWEVIAIRISLAYLRNRDGLFAFLPKRAV